MKKGLSLLLLAGVVLYWALILSWNFQWRALETADPRTLMYRCRDARQYWREGMWWGWLKASCQDTYAMPVSKAILSIGSRPIQADLLDVRHHYKVAGVFTVLCILFLVAAVYRHFGAAAAGFCAFWSAVSNLLLSYAFNGGHNWAGQAFLWAGILLLPRPASSARRELGSGLCFSFSALSSYHLIPYAAACAGLHALVRLAQWARKKEGVGRLPWFILGFTAPPLIFLILGNLEPGGSYLEHFFENIRKTRAEASRYPSGHEYFFRFLASNESPFFLAALGACALWGLRSVALPLAATPVLVLLFLEFSGNLKLGRIYMPILPFVFLWAAVGSVQLLQYIRRWKGGFVVAAALGLLLWLSNFPLQRRSYQEFHAGEQIKRYLLSRGVPWNEPVLVAGLQVPYAYFQERELRVYKRTDLKELILAGADWVFMSFYSGWWGGSFVEETNPSVIPAKEIFKSSAPYTAFPGVESSRLHPFINEGYYFLIRRNLIPFPVENRLYRGRDILPYL